MAETITATANYSEVQLFEILLAEFKEPKLLEEGKRYNGICQAVDKLYEKDVLTYKQWWELTRSLIHNKPRPNIYAVFYNHPSFSGGDPFWWKKTMINNNEKTDLTEISDNQRVLFLEAVISDMKNNG